MQEKVMLTETAFLSSSEEMAIEKKINFELNTMQLNMTRIGGITNIISGIFVILIMYGQAKLSTLFIWYAVLVFFNLINMLFSFFYQYSKVQPEKITPWLRVYHYVTLPPVCLIWGVMGILFISADFSHQVYVISFLLAVLVGFSFGTVTDFIASVISISCLLIPYLSLRMYFGVKAIILTGHDPDLHLGFSVCLSILGIFLLVACYIGFKLMKKSFKLSFINAALKQKLENMNKFLEQRVKERTIELESSLKQVTYQATHDALTDLPNQQLLLKHISSAIKSADQKHQFFCTVFLSLNEIQKINEGLGYQTGDLVIQTVAHRFRNALTELNDAKASRHVVTLSRQDVFVILLEPIIQLEDIEKQMQYLFSILTKPISVGKQTLQLTASVGVSIYPRDGANVKSLLINAGSAMLLAKQQGGNAFKMYEVKLNENVSDQLQLENDLHHAIKNNEFIVHYQPFINLKSGLICGMEALVRWQHPTSGLIPPIRFIPLAEANGIIIPLGEWVLRTACLQMRRWQEAGFSGLKIAVNLSAKQLQKKDIFDVIYAIVKETEVDPHCVELELTETEAFQDDVIPLLLQFKEMGCSLSIDDFGTGYSGLSNLKQLAIDKLKIDKSFVDDIVTNPDSQAIVTHTITLAKNMKVHVIAEGVENKDQLHFLKSQGCDMVQGYYFSKPVSAEQCTELLRNYKKFNTN